MHMKTKYQLFLPSLFIGTIITLSSSSWFSAWVGLEVNLMSMAPILIGRLSPNSIESSIKYFIFQAFASTLLIFFIFTSYFFSMWNSLSILSPVVTASLLFKTGMAPFQFWFPQVVAHSEWFGCLLLLTWQKIAPFSLILFNFNFMVLASILSSAVVGALGGINLSNTKLLIAYSSILHGAWMLSLIMCNTQFWLIYISFYSFIVVSSVFPLIKMNISVLPLLYSMKTSTYLKPLFILNFMSLAGMPPFLGFTLKVLTLSILLKAGINIFILSTLVSASLLSFYFYLRVSMSSIFSTWWNNDMIDYTYFATPSIWGLLPGAISLLGSLVLPCLILLT